jgi:hypothetical protein
LFTPYKHERLANREKDAAGRQKLPHSTSSSLIGQGPGIVNTKTAVYLPFILDMFFLKIFSVIYGVYFKAGFSESFNSP